MARRRRDPADLEPPAHLVGPLVVADWLPGGPLDGREPSAELYPAWYLRRIVAIGDASRLRRDARLAWATDAGLTARQYRDAFPVQRSAEVDLTGWAE